MHDVNLKDFEKAKKQVVLGAGANKANSQVDKSMS